METSFNIGSGLGIAVFSAVAVSRTNDVLSGAGQRDQLFALTEGFQSAFSVGVVIAVLGLLAALALLGRRHATHAVSTHAGTALGTNGGN